MSRERHEPPVVVNDPPVVHEEPIYDKSNKSRKQAKDNRHAVGTKGKSPNGIGKKSCKYWNKLGVQMSI